MKFSFQLVIFIFGLFCLTANAHPEAPSYTYYKGGEALALLRNISQNGMYVMGATWTSAQDPAQCKLFAYRTTSDGYERCYIDNFQLDIPVDGSLCNAGKWTKNAVVQSGNYDALAFAGTIRVELGAEQFWSLFGNSHSAPECVRMERD